MSYDRIEVPMDIEMTPGWLSWVAATTTCLRAMGSEIDAVDVSGYSGYAFHMTINGGCCPSGPTCLDWCALPAGIAIACGRSATSFVSFDCFTNERRNDRNRVHARHVLDLAAREVEAGRPCVVWGLGVPEFGVVRGVDDGDFLCVPWGPTPERVSCEELAAPGGPALYAFPAPNQPHRGVERFAIRRGAQAMMRLARGENEVCGVPAYDAWAGHLAGRRANRFGNSYNAQCWAEARAHARDFVARATERCEGVAEPLGHARDAFAETADALGEVAKLFPFTQEPGEIEDDGEIETAVGLLRQAKAAEERALEAMIAALASWPADDEPPY